MPATLWMLALSITNTEFGMGQGCIWSNTPATKCPNSSPVNEWSKTSKCRIPSSDKAGRIEYLIKHQGIDEKVCAKVPFASYEKIPQSRTLSNRSPSKIAAKGNSAEMTFICKYKVLRLEMFPHKHLIVSAIIFIAFDSRACNLYSAVLKHHTCK
jgi:hypothetical protein